MEFLHLAGKTLIIIFLEQEKGGERRRHRKKFQFSIQPKDWIDDSKLGKDIQAYDTLLCLRKNKWQ